MGLRVMVMAGGTGGHVYPALAVARELQQRGAEICWLGTPDSFESRLIPAEGIDLELVTIRGLRGKGAAGWLMAPLRLLRALGQALKVMARRRPQVVLGMGGFASGPGGLAARLRGIPLVIHEQNAVPGLTNRMLARIASRVLEAFPGAFGRDQVTHTGNPVRADISALPDPASREVAAGHPLRLLVLGGSQGARALNQGLPRILGQLPEALLPRIRHQAGRGKDQETLAAYRQAGIEAEVVEFISDMAGAYANADLVVCRAGALTVAELAAAGVASLLVPFPYAVDDHQTRNADYLVQAGAARLVQESEFDSGRLADELQQLLSLPTGLRAMAEAARAQAITDATRRVADICEEAAAA